MNDDPLFTADLYGKVGVYAEIKGRIGAGGVSGQLTVAAWELNDDNPETNGYQVIHQGAGLTGSIAITRVRYEFLL